jgi:hypothetical protein
LSPSTNYSIIILLRGIDLIKDSAKYRWFVEVSLTTLAFCTLDFLGNGARLKSISYDLVYYKKSLILNNPESPNFFHTKLLPVTRRTGCAGPAGGGFGGCIAYNGNINPIKIFQNSYFLGTNYFNTIPTIHYSIGINSNTLDSWLLPTIGFMH